MIAGETEAILQHYGREYEEEYDEFFGLFKKKDRTPEEEAERKEKRSEFWKGVGNTVKDLANLVIKPDPNTVLPVNAPETPAPVDYQFSVGNTYPEKKWENRNSESREDDKDKDEKKNWPVLPLVVGAVLFVGLGYYAVTQLKKANQLAT